MKSSGSTSNCFRLKLLVSLSFNNRSPRRYRLEYAAGVLPMEYFLASHLSSSFLYRWVAGVCRFIDSLEDKPIIDKIDWNSSPYSRVTRERSLYWDRKRFEVAMLEELNSGHGTPGTFRNLSPEKKNVPIAEIRQAWHKMRSFEADYRFAVSGFQRALIRLHLFASYLVWVISFFAGFATLGFCWPRKLRRFFCAPSTTSKGKDDQPNRKKADSVTPDTSFLNNAASESTTASKDSRYEALEKKIDGMKGSIEDLQKAVETLLRLHSEPERPQDGD